MKVSYRREMKHNYMIIEPDTQELCGYLCQMLEFNAIEGLLRFRMRQVDGEARFYYEITSRQPLSLLLENQPVKYDQIRNLVLGIAGALSQMERYLLPENCVILKPEYIYVEPEQFRVWLCLVPGISRNFPEDCGRLLEYLLSKVDHQDKAGVLLAYGMYQESRKENYGLQDLLRQVEHCGRDLEPEFENRKKPESGSRPKSESGSRKVTGAGSGKEEQTETEAHGPQRGMLSRQREQVPDRQDLQKSPYGGGRNRFANWWRQRFLKPEEAPAQVPWEIMFYEDEENDPSPAVPRSSTEPQLPAAVQPGQDTVLLADLSPVGGERLRGLYPLDEAEEEIVLSYYPFIIGKQENLVDYLLQKETVSRLHLRIDREGDKYLIKDLNSTNGTVVSGYMLEANEAVELHIGEEVSIAGHRYQFK